MPLRFDHGRFFDGFRPFYRSVTGFTLDQDKVASIEFLLTQFENNESWTRIQEIAYAFATIHIETYLPKTNNRYNPIREGGGKAYFIRRYWTNTKIRHQLGNKSEYDAWARCGRGYVQETGLANDTKFTKLLGIDLITNPDLAMDPDVAFKIMTAGMFHGIFTGKAIGRFINDDDTDYYNARTVINGHDRASEIAGLAKHFEQILSDALITSTEQDPAGSKVDPPNDEPTPSPVELPEPGAADQQAPASGDGDQSAAISDDPPADPSPVNTPDTTQVNQMQPYLGTGFVSVIKGDLAKITGGNVTMQTISGYRDDIAQWGIPAKVILNLAAVVIAISAIYLIFRLVHYGVWVLKEHQRIKAELAVNTDPAKPNIEWTNTKVTLPDTIQVPAVVVVSPPKVSDST